MALAVFAVGCGDGDSPAPTVTAREGGGAQSGVTAAGLVPDLTPLGFVIGQSERDPAAQPGQDAHRALFQQSGAPKMGARVDVSVSKDIPTAMAQWASTSTALKNPPPDLFGASSSQNDTAATGIGDQSKAYITAKPDPSGTQVWTDVYRFGRAVVIVQVLSRDEAAGQKARVAIAEMIRDRAR
ncbi:MAG: hypothetical protein ABIP13_01665 [Tepidiformaceae bacterium]